MKVFILLLFCIFCFAGCNNSENPISKAKKAEAEACLAMGGIPIRSLWDSTVMTDCKFPPVKHESR